MSTDENASRGLRINPIMGTSMKTQLYQTPDSNCGIPGIESAIAVKDAKTAIKAIRFDRFILDTSYKSDSHIA